MEDAFCWHQHFDSLCNAPLDFIELQEFDDAHPALVFYAYWKRLADGEMPQKASFSPTEVKSVLKWFMLFKREWNGEEDQYFLYLQGNSAAEITNGNLQGKYLHEFTAEDCYGTRRDLMRQVISEGKPGFARACISERGSEYTTDVTVGMFPFREGENDFQVFVVPAPESKQIRRYL